MGSGIHSSSGAKIYTTTPQPNSNFHLELVDYQFQKIAVDSLSRIYICFTNSMEFVTNMYDSLGSLTWSSKYLLPALYIPPFPFSLAIDNSSNVFVTGMAHYFSSARDFVTIKYNSSGIKQWVQRYYNLPAINDEAIQVATDFSGNAYVTGYSIGLGTEYDYLTIKYPSSMQLNAKIILEGYYDTINNNLRKRDTVTAFLRNSNSPYQIVDSAKALIDPFNFTAGFCFNNADSGSYYIMLRHRNSIETWSKLGGETMSRELPYYYDFTNSTQQAFGGNLRFRGGKYCIYSGDVNQDGFIEGADALAVDNDTYLFATGYLATDLTGDNSVDGSDAAIADNNIAKFIERIVP